MRIAVYHNLHSGGAKRTLFEEVYRLAQRHQLDLYSPNSADNDFCDVRPFVKQAHIYDFQPGRLFNSPFGRLNQAVRLQDLSRLRALNRQIAADIDAGDYDVVLVHPCRYTQAPLLLNFLKAPSVYYCHEPFRMLYEMPIPRSHNQRAGWRRGLDQLDLLDRLYRRTLKKIDCAASQKATLVITNSRFTQQNIQQIYQVSAAVSYHGIDLKNFGPLNLPRENMVVSVGALTPNKGFDFIIESLGQISSGLRPALVIVSNYQEPAERDYLEQLAQFHKVQLSLRTLVPNDELVRLYNIAKMVVYTPVLEPFGLVPLEAMACGTPVVAVREGGVHESVVDERTGLLVERNPHAFALAVERLLRDPELAARLGQQARDYTVADWTWDRSIQKLEAQLRSVVKGAQQIEEPNQLHLAETK